MKILVVEDEIDLLNAIARGLRASGYAVDKCGDGKEALELILINEYDLVILDLNLPSMDGIDILKEVRNHKKHTKILILSARGSVEEKVLGLDLGANDYLTKPFHFDELEARVRLLMRTKIILEDNIVKYEELKIDTLGRCAYVGNEKLNLTKKEFGILEYLILHRGKVISQETLIEHVWDSSVDSFSNSVRVHLNSLRKKLKGYMNDEIIDTVKGVGYIIEDHGGK